MSSSILLLLVKFSQSHHALATACRRLPVVDWPPTTKWWISTICCPGCLSSLSCPLFCSVRLTYLDCIRGSHVFWLPIRLLHKDPPAEDLEVKVQREVAVFMSLACSLPGKHRLVASSLQISLLSGDPFQVVLFLVPVIVSFPFHLQLKNWFLINLVHYLWKSPPFNSPLITQFQYCSCIISVIF